MSVQHRPKRELLRPARSGADATDRHVGRRPRSQTRPSGLGFALVATLVSAGAPGLARAVDPPAPTTVAFRVVAGGIPEPLTAAPGDAARGRALIVAGDAANCALCHAVPDAAVRFAGDLGPSLAGVGARLSVPELRLRIADNLRLNPATIMPSYHRTDGLDRVAPAYRGKPILSAPQVEDVVAYLATLR